MSISNTPSTTRPKRHTIIAALLASSVVALVACGTGSLLVGTVGGDGSIVADASLSSLHVIPGVLTPAFNSDTTSYAVAVSSATASVTVSATATVPTSTITVNGTPLPNGGTSSSIPLNQGSTANILVTVLASDSTTSRTYNIAVLRASQ